MTHIPKYRQGAWRIEGVLEGLHALAQDGLSASQIAEKLNRKHWIKLTRNAVIGQVFRSRITLARSPKKGLAA